MGKIFVCVKYFKNESVYICSCFFSGMDFGRDKMRGAEELECFQFILHPLKAQLFWMSWVFVMLSSLFAGKSTGQNHFIIKVRAAGWQSSISS